jgi:hypothetical protein
MNSKKPISSFLKFNPEDIACSIFCLSTWTPNRSSEVKLLYSLISLLSLKAEECSSNDGAFEYENFVEICDEIIKKSPNFGMMEDFVTEGDWGEVRYHFEEENWRIPYGSSLDWGYDFLTSFKMIYSNYADQIQTLTNENPIDHLRGTLSYLDFLIKLLPNEHGETEIEPGHIEIPSFEFWKACKESIRLINQNLPKEFMETFSITLSSIDSQDLDVRTFSNNCFDGSKYNFMFINMGSYYIPTIPRRAYPVLIEYWSEKSKSILDRLEEPDAQVAIQIGLTVGHFAKDRIKKNYIYPLVSIGKPSEHPDPFIFPFSILSEEKILLFAFTDPFSSKSLEDQLKDLDTELKRVKAAFDHDWCLTLNGQQSQIALRNGDNKPPIPHFIVIISNKTTTPFSFTRPKDLDDIWCLEQFIGIIDEIKNHDELSQFLEYQKSLGDSVRFISIGVLDLFASFKDSHQTLISGAIKPTFISIDPHWGSSRRFRSLKKFWTEFPDNALYGDPRQWEIKQRIRGRISLASRCRFEIAHSVTVGNCTITLTSPVDRITHQEVLITDLIMQALADILLDYKEKLANHPFFKNANQLTITFLPYHLKEHSDFAHIKHIELGDQMWAIEIGYFGNQEWGTRIIFDILKVQDHQTGVKNRILDVKLFQGLLTELNKHYKDDELFYELISMSEIDSTKKARYTVIQKEKTVSFPEFVDPAKPEDKHFKRVRNTIANLAKDKGIEPGSYDLTEAKKILKTIISEVNSEISKTIELFSYTKSLEFIISKIDALTNSHEISGLNLSETDGRDINFDPSTSVAKENETFLTMHRNYRHLIEFFVLKNPEGDKAISREDFSYLIALIDWFFVFSGASDQIHFDLSPVSLEVTSDYLVNVEYDHATKEKLDIYGSEQAKRSLGITGKKSDKIVSPRDPIIYLELVDKAFTEELGFGIRYLTAVLQILTLWPTYSTDSTENEYYCEKPSNIVEICKTNIIGMTDEICYQVLMFLTLRKVNLLKIIGSQDALMLPVWEYYKRHSRYATKPLIETENGLLWGPHSTQRTSKIWMNAPMIGKLPLNVGNRILDTFIEEKRLIENQLAIEAGKIAQRHSELTDINVQLHKRDKDFGHPPELGDYDVICYLKDANILVIAECKHLLPVYCLKDARDLREDIFGKVGKPGYLEKINRRTAYATEKTKEIFSALKWEYPSGSSPTIVSLYISIHTYWWARFPPIKTEIKFIQVDSFDDLLISLSKTIEG